MTLRVYINPTYTTPDQADGGVRRVCDAQVKYLPEFGIEVVSNADHADLIANHGTLLEERQGVPMISHNHGLYWSSYQWPSWGHRANAQVIEALIRCNAATAPSHWVANAISRGVLFRPEVVYHGVDVNEWEPGESLGYVLWNKARVDPVSDPRDAMRLAVEMPDVPFVSTFGREDLPNVKLTGALPHQQMKEVIQRAGVYLCTARETFGIGTLEALAAGVPVVGWKYGGQEEIVVNGETGYLVEYGDYRALADAVRQALANRTALSDNARIDARNRWGWKNRIRQYADIYHAVVGRATAVRPRVSIVITSYNLNRYLPIAFNSAITQADEVVVIDDCGTEDAASALPDSARVVRTPHNLGLSGARNYGASLATGKYLLFLDADDMLAENAVQRLSLALDADPGLHIAYGSLDLVNHEGQDRRRNAWPGAFDWRGQMAHLNQLHYASLWRRESFLRTGGYRARDWRAEDASLWCRATSFGLRAAQVTNEPTLIYRLRSDSKSVTEARAYADRDGDWTAWYPWRLGAKNADEGRTLLEQGKRPRPALVPFGAPVDRPRIAWPVPHHQEPIISVIIPVGPGHAPYVVDALDSLIAQTFAQWEALVINDTGQELKLPGHPFATVWDVNRLEGDTVTRMGAGAARNWGVRHARAPLVLFLDADDALRPEALRTFLEAYASSGASYAYSDTLSLRADGKLADALAVDWRSLPDYRQDAPLTVIPAVDYDQAFFLKLGYRDGLRGGHSVTALVEKEAALSVGGFDEELIAHEDNEFFLKLAVNGFCGVRAPQPLLIYRLGTGERRKIGKQARDKLDTELERRYAAYGDGKAMAKRCCGGRAVIAQQVLVDPQEEAVEVASSPVGGPIRMRYVGDKTGEHTVMGRPSGTNYRVANNAFSQFFNADPRDIEYLMSMRNDNSEPIFKVVRA